MEYVEIEDALLKRSTDKAGLFDIDGDDVWIPWSQVEDNGEDLKVGYVGSIYVSEWFAEKDTFCGTGGSAFF